MATTSDKSLLQRTVKNGISGTAAGIAVTLTGHPFDTLKVRLQTQPVHNPVYKGLLDCFIKTLKWEGIGGLYKGVGSPLAGQMFFRATLFTSYYQISSTVAGKERQGQRLTTVENFMCGAMTGGIVSFVEGPVDLFKTKMQIQIIRARTGAPVQYRHVFHAGYVIARTYGIRGVYQGLGATMQRNIPAFGTFFCIYEIIRNYFTPEGGTVNDVPFQGLLCAGGIGGFFYWFMTYPTDVIKSTMQSDHSDKSKRSYRSIMQCIKGLYREGGYRRFFRGFLPCLMRSIPANAVQLLVLEKFRQLFP